MHAFVAGVKQSAFFTGFRTRQCTIVCESLEWFLFHVKALPCSYMLSCFFPRYSLNIHF